LIFTAKVAAILGQGRVDGKRRLGPGPVAVIGGRYPEA